MTEIAWPADRVERRPVETLAPYARNARTHSDRQIAEIAASIRQWGWTIPILCDEAGMIIAGHGRVLAANRLGITEVPVMVATGWTEAQKRAYVVADNKLTLNAGWDEELLALELGDLKEQFGFDLTLTGFSEDELAGLLLGDDSDPGPPKVSLAERFGVPPFSVLNAREGWWQARKAAWLALGIQSELGRGENLLRFSDTINEPDPAKRAAKKANGKAAARTFGQDLMRGEHIVGKGKANARGRKANAEPAGGGGGGWAEFNRKRAERANAKAIQTTEWVRGKISDGDIDGGMASMHTGTSIFDPVLCELAYRWFCPPGGAILDPFAGGSVRGIVASKLGRSYLGVDLSAAQIAANEAQAARICTSAPPRWIAADSRDIDGLAEGLAADFVFSCPPYADLEIYSDDPRDLSTLAYPDFRAAYREIIAKACALLKDDRFACFVVGEVRGKGGGYYGFVPDTIAAFQAAGLEFYNEAILVTAAGSLPIRTAKQFEASRKLGKTHQNVLVFVKGDPKKATAAIGPVEFAAIDEAGDADYGEAL